MSLHLVQVATGNSVKETSAEYYRRWRAENPEKSSAARKRYRERHPERAAEQSRRWREAHPDWDREWRKNNPEVVRGLLCYRCNVGLGHFRGRRGQRASRDFVSRKENSMTLGIDLVLLLVAAICSRSQPSAFRLA